MELNPTLESIMGGETWDVPAHAEELGRAGRIDLARLAAHERPCCLDLVYLAAPGHPGRLDLARLATPGRPGYLDLACLAAPGCPGSVQCWTLDLEANKSPNAWHLDAVCFANVGTFCCISSSCLKSSLYIIVVFT